MGVNWVFPEWQLLEWLSAERIYKMLPAYGHFWHRLHSQNPHSLLSLVCERLSKKLTSWADRCPFFWHFSCVKNVCFPSYLNLCCLYLGQPQSALTQQQQFSRDAYHLSISIPNSICSNISISYGAPSQTVDCWPLWELVPGVGVRVSCLQWLLWPRDQPARPWDQQS